MKSEPLLTKNLTKTWPAHALTLLQDVEYHKFWVQQTEVQQTEVQHDHDDIWSTADQM